MRACCLVLVFCGGLLLFPSAASAVAPIRIPGAAFNAKKAKDGEAFAQRGWTTSGSPEWSHRSGKDFAVRLPAKSSVRRKIEVTPITAAKGEREVVAPETWCGFVSVEMVAAEPNASVRFALQPAEGDHRHATFSYGRPPEPGQVAWLHVPATAMSLGEWELTISSDSGSVVIDNVRWVWLPTQPKAMRFAKPNGFNGPDRIESGALGFAAYSAHRHSPLPVHSVRADGPAAKAGLEPGDIIVALAGDSFPRNSCAPGTDWFDRGHEALLSRSVERALATEEPRVGLTVLREKDGGANLHAISIALAKRPPLPKNFPFDDEVTPALYDDVINFVRRTRTTKGKHTGTWSNGGNRWIQTSFAGLALLGRRDPDDRVAIREIADWFLERFHEPEQFGNLGYWSAGYAGIFLMEYALATGDERVLPWAKRALTWVERGSHTSKWGTTALGHGPNGLPYGFKALMAPATHVIVFEALAKRAGVESRVWESILPYMKQSWSDPAEGGHGAMGYNRAARDKGQFWSRTGLFALAAQLRDTEPTMRHAMAKIMRERHAWMRNSHAYGYPGDAWGLIGLSQIDDAAFREVMQEWRWAYGGAWEPGYGLRHSTAHMGSPYMGGEGLINPAFAALLSVRHGGLVITGAKDRGWLDVSDLPVRPTAVKIGRDGRGQVNLRAIVPGCPIYFTRDGTEPTADSPRYAQPFALNDGGTVTARTIATDAKLGPIARATLGLPKTDWRALMPSAEEVDAHARARLAVDHDPKSAWRTNRGFEQPGFPFTLTIDLGSMQRLRGIRLRETDALAIDLAARKERETPDQEIVVGKHRSMKDPTGRKLHSPRVPLREFVEARYLEITFLSGVHEKHLSVGEVELIRPTVTSNAKADGTVTLTCDDSTLELRVSTDGSTPTAKSPLYSVPMTNKSTTSHPILARAFTPDGRPMSAVHVVSTDRSTKP